jgi:hypothetical protein
MKHLRISLLAAVLAAAGLSACTSDDGTSGFRSAITGEACEPDPTTLTPRGRSGEQGNGGHDSPTGIPGDNMDDESSGKVDCYYDGNSGQGDDKKHPCCDAEMCCNVDDPGEPEEPTDPEDPGEPEEPTEPDEPTEEPTDPDEPSEPTDPLPPVD